MDKKGHRIEKAEFILKADGDGFSAEIMGNPADIAYLLCMAMTKKKEIRELIEVAMAAMNRADEQVKNN